MHEILHAILGSHTLSGADFHQYVVALFLIIIVFVAMRYLPNSLQKFILKSNRVPYETTVVVKNILFFFIAWIGIIAILSTLGVGTGIAAFSSAFVLAVSFALQQVLESLVAGFYILGEKPFHIGDYISVAGSEGKVTEIKLRTTIVYDIDGVENRIPNLMIFTSPVKNYKKSNPRSIQENNDKAKALEQARIIEEVSNEKKTGVTT